MDGIPEITKLLSSKFEKDLFDASIASLNDKANKLRFNNFAYSLRELSRHFLQTLAPDENIKKCSWYDIVTENGKSARSQRIRYAIQGGISDELLLKLGFDINELKAKIQQVKATIDSLSKYTHINPDVFDLSDDVVETLSFEVLSVFKDFILTIESYREELKTFLDEHIEEHMITTVVSNSFENLDSLAPHYSLNYSELSDYHISKISDHEIEVIVYGELYVTLEYGSRQERKEGDGLDLDKSFPFEMIIRYQIGEDFPPQEYSVEEFDADTSAWYGEDDYIDDEIDPEIDSFE